MNFAIIYNIAFAILLPSLAWFFRHTYPKEINSIYGYRTRRSMASQEAWLEANSYAFRQLFKGSFFIIPVQLILFIVFTPLVAIIGAAGAWIIILFLIIFITEQRLKKMEKDKRLNVKKLAS